jgi:23S rRNA pseudouridine2605 synthase
LLTNDGDFAQEVIHPSKGIVKTYEVKIFGQVTEALIKKMKKGVEVEGVFLKPDTFRIVGFLQNKTWLEFKLAEGKNREIRKICEAFGLTVDKLKRVAIGGLTCDGVAPGKIRVLNKRQLLEAINSKDGYRSSKKTIKAPRETFRKGKVAESEDFHHLRKESYYTTIETMKKTGTGVYKRSDSKNAPVKKPAESN